jgi:8-oxo-dGTP pyrophosphatase MutT (NUDIX family)
VSTRPDPVGAAPGGGREPIGTSAAEPARAAEGERYNPGPPTAPRQAAAVILLKDGPDGPELLLVKRTEKARFMAGVWVFPGGALRAGAPEAQAEQPAHAEAAGAARWDAHRMAAARELEEEAGVRLAPGQELVELARWITPRQVQTRFDTRFFLATLPAGQVAAVDGEECVDLRWLTPARALADHAAGTIALVFPTIKQLEQLVELLAAHATVDALIEALRGRPVEAVEPRVIVAGGQPRIVLPGEPGYDTA